MPEPARRPHGMFAYMSVTVDASIRYIMLGRGNGLRDGDNDVNV